MYNKKLFKICIQNFNPKLITFSHPKLALPNSNTIKLHQKVTIIDDYHLPLVRIGACCPGNSADLQLTPRRCLTIVSSTPSSSPSGKTRESHQNAKQERNNNNKKKDSISPIVCGGGCTNYRGGIKNSILLVFFRISHTCDTRDGDLLRNNTQLRESTGDEAVVTIMLLFCARGGGFYSYFGREMLSD